MADKRKLSTKEAKMRARKRDNQFKFIAIAVVASVLLIIMIFYFLNIDFVNVTGSQDTFTATGNNGSFPYSIDTTSDTSILSATRDNLIHLDDNNLYFINPSNGGNVKTVNHFYSNPVIDINGKYVLTYDQDKYRLRIDTSTNVICDNELEQNIITASISENGTYAVATTSKKAFSQATIYSRSLKKLFTWYSTDGYIIDMAISDNGKYTAIAAIKSKDTLIDSTVHIFDNKTGEIIKKFEYHDNTIAHLQYAGNSLFVLCDDEVSLIQNNEDKIDIVKHNSSVVICYDIPNNSDIRIVTGDYFDSPNSTLSVYNRKGELKKAIKLTGNVKSIAGSSSITSVLFDDKIEYYNSSYELKNTLKLDAGAFDIEYFSSNAYALTNQQIIKERLK